MQSSNNPFGTLEMARGYANSRPPLHARIVDLFAPRLPLPLPVNAASDIGCGSGLSTAPLLKIARRVIGVEPNHAMAALAGQLFPDAAFVQADAETLPFADASVDLLTAAGSLNYADPIRFFETARRVLVADGAVCVYDFEQNASLAPGFVERYPVPVSEAKPLSPEILAAMNTGFRPVASEHFRLPVEMTLPRYVDYLMTETNVAAAIRRGIAAESIRSWIQESAAAQFDGGPREVFFQGYYIVLL